MASLHVDACIHNVIIQEFFYPYLGGYSETLTVPIGYENGYLNIPDGGGLGTDIREEAIHSGPPVEKPYPATWIGSNW